MPPPTVMLTMAAARPNVPMARSNGSEVAVDAAGLGGGAVGIGRSLPALMLRSRRMPVPTRDVCAALDRDDALAPLRAQFALDAADAAG